MKRVLLVGAGTIGTSWATFFLTRGLDVYLYDVDEKRLAAAAGRIEGQIETLVRGGLMPGPGHDAQEPTREPDGQATTQSASAITHEADTRATTQQTDARDTARQALARLATTTEIARAKDVDFVQENGPEDYDVKAAIFAELDRLIDPAVPVASSSSGLLISRLQERVRFPRRYLIAHPFNPPHLIPLVELVPGPQTEAEIVEAVRSAFVRWGKTPVTLNAEVPGHIANRLAAALWREAIALVERGVASVADIDRAVTAGLGVRWSIMGPHLTYHLGGGDGGIRQFWHHLGPAFESYFADLSPLKTLAPETLDSIERGLAAETGERSVAELAAWRDEKLIRVLRALSE